MNVTLEHITPDAEAMLGHAASICYDSNTEREACLRRAAHCVTSGHLAVLRFANATFLVEGISRVCSHQLVRVAHAGILQRSQRYVKETSVEFVDPPALDTLDYSNRAMWRNIQAMAEAMYLRAIDAGMKKEDARYILPQGCTTSLRITGNFQMWRDLLGNRTTKHAQWEVRECGVAIAKQLAEHAPRIFGDIVNAAHI